MTVTDEHDPNKDKHDKVRERREQVRMWAAILSSMAAAAQAAAELWKK